LLDYIENQNTLREYKFNNIFTEEEPQPHEVNVCLYDSKKGVLYDYTLEGPITRVDNNNDKKEDSVEVAPNDLRIAFEFIS